MARTIYFNINEKLAMLKIMIDISNHYSERLPYASQIIRRRSETLLELSNGMEEANNMPLTEALDIVNDFKRNEDKIDFIKELLAEMLQYSHYGAFQKYENSDYDDSYELMDEFRTEWNYIYQLLREIILIGDAKDLFTIELISWRYVYKHFEDWVVTDEKDKNCQEKKDNEISKAMTWEEQIYF